MLAQVCSRWRGVAFETGSLWSCVVLFYYRENCESVLTSAQIQLERTRGSPVDLFISHNFCTPIGQGFRSTLDLIKPYMKQLRSLTTKFYREKDIEYVLESLLEHGTTGSLSRLDISGGFSSSPLFNQADSQTLERLDEYLRPVRSLSLRKVMFHRKRAVFEQLEELEFENLYASDFLSLTQLAEMLSASPNLRHLSLNHVEIDEGDPVPHLPVKLQYLKKLGFYRMSDTDFQGVVSILTLGKQASELTLNFASKSAAMLGALRLLAINANI